MSPMVEFTKTQLHGLGLLEGKEFSIRKVVDNNGNEQDQVITKERWFGGRLARHHKIKSGEDRTDKQMEYGQAKTDILRSLKKIYGDEIGEKAFKAHIGRTVNGVFETSSDHPITSSQPGCTQRACGDRDHICDIRSMSRLWNAS